MYVEGRKLRLWRGKFDDYGDMNPVDIPPHEQFRYIFKTCARQ